MEFLHKNRLTCNMCFRYCLNLEYDIHEFKRNFSFALFRSVSNLSENRLGLYSVLTLSSQLSDSIVAV